MKCIVWIAAVVVSLCGTVASGQVTASVEFTASRFTNPGTTTYLYGPTFGLSTGLAGEHRVRLAFDLRGEVLGTKQRYNGVELGPLVSFSIRHFEPYAEFLVGFARYNDGVGNVTTDAQIAVNTGVTRALRGRLGWRVFEYGYKQYYALGGAYNPKSFSTGLTYTIGAR